MFAKALNASLLIATLTGVAVAQKIKDPFAISAKSTVGAPDVAYSTTTSHYLSVWQHNSVATSIRARRVTHTGSVVGAEIAISNGVFQNYAPTVAYVRKTDRFLVCWYRRPLIGGRAQIVGRTVNPSNGVMSSVRILVTSSEDNTLPALGGDRTKNDDKAMLLWRRHAKGVLSTRVRVPSAGAPSVFGGSYYVSKATDATTPAISRSGGLKRRYMATFVKTVGFQGREVFGRAIGANAAPDGGEVQVSFGLGNDDSPSVDGNGEDFFVGWHRDQTGAPAKKDVYARALRYDGSKAVLNGNILTIAATDLDQREPAVSFLQKRFLIAWSSEYPTGNPNYHDLYFRLYGLGSAIHCASGHIRGSGLRDGDPAIASRYAGGTSIQDDGLVVFASSKSSKFVDSTITGQRLEAIGTGGKIKDLGNGCGLGGQASTYSAFAVGNPLFGLRLTGAGGASKLAVLNLSPVQPPLVICGTCHITEPTITWPVVVSGGKAGLQLPVPCDSKLMNKSMIFQFYVLGSRSTPCAGLDGISFSNSLQATIGF